jgi:hypothetical protein
MKKIIVHIIFLLLALPLFSQNYGNEWVQYDQKYLKFPVVQNGIYRINYTNLNNALNTLGENINAIDPRNFQVFGKGGELYIHVEGEADGSFDPTDYIEFYGEKNTGWLDALVYDSPESQNNPYYSLFNDTIFYFLTWNNSTTNRRMSTLNDLTFSGSPIPYFINQEIVMGTSNYYQGWYDASGKSQIAYTEVEGYYFPEMSGIGASRSLTVPTPNPYTGTDAPSAVIEAVASGVNNPLGAADHHLLVSYKGSGSENVFYNQTFNDFKLQKMIFTLQSSEIGNASTVIKFSNGSSANTATKVAPSYAKITYPQIFNLQSRSSYYMTIPANSVKSYIQITNFSSDNTSFFYDLTNNYRIAVSQSGTTIHLNIPAGGEKKCYIATNNNIIQVENFKKVSSNGYFRDFTDSNPDSAFILVSHPKLWSTAIKYSSYRATLNGGNHDTITANMNMLYDMFSYGIPKHPLAIKNFCDYLIHSLPSSPQHLFLLGKSISAQRYRNNATNYANSLVPSFGSPPSDLLFTAGLSGNYYEPAIPTGRVSANNTQQAELYYNKVVELELNQRKANDITNPDNHTLVNKDWMKHVLHFGGGTGTSEQTQIQNYLNNYKSIIEDVKFGGQVNSVFKETSAIIAPNLADTIRDWINYGASLITFFGHSSAQGFDISLDEPSFYNNKGKYPLFIANGCFSGNIHLPLSALMSTSEQFVLIEDKGAIGFISSVDLAYSSRLNQYTQEFYHQLGRVNYGNSIGTCMKFTAKSLIQMATNPNDFQLKDIILQMSLHGDPSVKLNYHQLPDYFIDRSTVSFSPEKITSELNSFDLNVAVYNIGMATNDPVSVLIERTQNGKKDTTIVNLPHIHYVDTIKITYPLDVNSAGLNSFKIYVDWLENVVELSETNNSIEFPPIDLWISSEDIIPIYPYNYAIIKDTMPILKASTADLFAPTRSYLFQIDTTDTYNSSMGGPIDEFRISQSGGVVHWTPNITNLILNNDSIVFFWRVTPEDNLTRWREHSFQYIKGKTGWSQDHFFQFKNNQFQYFDYDRNTRKFDFIPVYKQLTCKTIANASSTDAPSVEYRIDGELQDWNIPTGTPGIYIAVIDSTSLTAWEVYDPVYNPDSPHNYGNWNNNGTPGGGRSRADKYFIFRPSNATEMNAMVNMLENEIPEGNYILMYTAVRGYFQTYWNNSHFLPYNNMGATQINGVGDSIPYIFFTQKGYPSKTIEVVGNGSSYNEVITLSALMESSATWAKMTSTLIGPANSWDSLHWNYQPLDGLPDEKIEIEIIGETFTGQKDIITTINKNQKDVYLGNLIDAKQYPFIYLRLLSEDNVQKTAGQIKKWQIIYDEIPEAALNPNVNFFFQDESVIAGQNLQFSIAIENVSNVNMDSLRIAYWIEDRLNQKHLISLNKNAPLLANQTMIDTILYQTSPALQGVNAFYVEVNPKDNLWQTEQYHFNNTAKLIFNVEKDKTNPLLDVTFDGIHILNGDIVSAQPNVRIELKDENPYLALDDTANFFIYLTYPNAVRKQIYFQTSSGQELIFHPGELPTNKAAIEWNPLFEEDGKYRLAVQARDKSKNLAGDYAYTIDFEVINKSTITQILNYPNPFTTSTKFVFTLTGSEIPDVFKIQILTVSGKVVREITQDEIGPIRIGRNISQYAWDGRDEYGDLLANGVYLYRVIVKINNQEIEHRESGADNYFTKGFGKMYLMR